MTFRATPQASYYPQSKPFTHEYRISPSAPPTMRQIISTTIMGMRVASICLVVYWLVIFTGTHLPTVRLPSFHSADKFYHFTAFAGLTFLLSWALPTSLLRPLRHIGFAFSIAIGYAVFDELTQMLVRGRSAEFLDFVADTVGAAVGLGMYLLIRRFIVKRGLQIARSSEPQAIDREVTGLNAGFEGRN